MLGQDALVTALHQRLLATAEGGAACVISGGPGAGKTFVADRFLRELPRTTARLRGRGLRTGGAPLLPICEAIRTCPEARDADRLRGVFEEYVQAVPYVKEALGPLFKATGGKTRHAGAALRDSIPSEAYTFVALARLLEALGDSDVPVLFLDDLQWVDRSSIGFLGYLASQIRNTRVFLLLTRRTNGKDDASVTALLETLRQEAGERSIEFSMGDLSREDEYAVLKGILGRVELAEEDLNWIHGSSRGNPYYLRELVTLLQAEGHLVNASGVWRLGSKPEGRLTPPSLQRHIRDRLARIGSNDPLALEVINFAACAGTVFDARVVADALSESHRRIASVLQILEDATGIVRREGRTTCFRFDHDLTRESVVSELGGFAQEIHGKLGAALAARAETLPAAVAFQFAAAGAGSDAIHWYLKAADGARAASLYDTALQYSSEAERVIVAAPEQIASDAVARVRCSIGAALVGAERYSEAIERLADGTDGLSEYEAAPIRHLRGRAAARVADEQSHRSAVIELRAALGPLRESGDDAACAAVWSDLIQAYDALGDYSASQASFREALRLAKQAGDHAAIVRLMRLTCVFWQPEKVIETIERALVVAKRHKLRNEEALCENNLGTAWFAVRDLDRARTHLTRAHAVLKSHGGFRCDVPLNNLGLLALAEDRLEEAAATFSAALHSALEPHNVLFIRSNRAVCRALAGDLPGAVTELRELVAAADATGDLFYRDCLRHNLAQALVEVGHPAEAYDVATACHVHHDAGDDLLVEGKRARLLARTFEARGQPIPEHVQRQADVLERTTKPQAWLFKVPWYYCDIEFWED